jgi:hypothetical protein
MGELGRPILSDVFVRQDASLGIAQEPRQRTASITTSFHRPLDSRSISLSQPGRVDARPPGSRLHQPHIIKGAAGVSLRV